MISRLKVGEREREEETHLFFADDTWIFCQPDERQLLNLIYVLSCFQVVFRLNINMAKSKMVRLGSGDNSRRLVSTLRCKMVNFPMKHLSMSLGAKCNNVRTWKPVVARFEKKFAGLKRSLLSKGRRLTLVLKTKVDNKRRAFNSYQKYIDQHFYLLHVPSINSKVNKKTRINIEHISMG